eukprot:383549_1
MQDQLLFHQNHLFQLHQDHLLSSGPPAVPVPSGPPVPVPNLPVLGIKKNIIVTKKAMKPRIKMKPFFWSPIHSRKIPGTIWEEITKLENEITSKHLNTLFHTQEMKNNKYNTLLIYGYIRLWKRLLSINTLEIPDAVTKTIIQFSTIYLEIEPKSLEELFHAKKRIKKKKPIKKPKKK